MVIVEDCLRPDSQLPTDDEEKSDDTFREKNVDDNVRDSPRNTLEGSISLLEDVFIDQNHRNNNSTDLASVSPGTSFSVSRRLSTKMSLRVAQFDAYRNHVESISPVQSLNDSTFCSFSSSSRPKVNESIVTRSDRKTALANRIQNFEGKNSKRCILRLDLRTPEEVRKIVKTSKNNNRLDPILRRYEHLSEEESQLRRELASKIAARERHRRLGCLKSKEERVRLLRRNRARFYRIGFGNNVATFRSSKNEEAGRTKDGVCDRVRAAPFDFTNFVPQSFSKSDIQHQLILNVVERSFVFKEFRKHGKARCEGALDALTNAFEPLTFQPAHVLLHEGTKEQNDQFYIVDEGKLNFHKDGKLISEIDEVGAYFGELALLYNVTSEHTVSVHESKQTHLLRIEQRAFRGLLRIFSKRAAKEKRDALLGVDFLHDLICENETLTNRLLSIMIREEMTLGETYNMSQDITFMVIQSGQMHVARIEKTLNPGDYFGSRALIGSLPRQSTNNTDMEVSSEKVVFFRIDNHSMGQIIGPSRLQNLMDMRRLVATPLIKEAKLSNCAHDLMAEGMSEKIIDEKDDNILEVDRFDPPAIYVVREGQLLVFSHDERAGVKTENLLTEGSTFGHAQLRLSTENGIPRYHRVEGLTVSSVDGQYASIGVLSLDEMATKSCMDVTHEAICFLPSTDKSTTGTFRKETHGIMPKEKKAREAIQSHLSFEDLEKIRLLGEGEFGEVWLVSANVSSEGSPEHRQKFALKSQLKIHRNHGFDNTDLIRREIEVMQKLRHSQLADLVTTYEDDASIHMLMRLVPHGELWDRIHVEDEQGNWSSGLPEDHAKFYAMSIADTLNYMHSKGIVYRDLKPENVLIDASGYPVIVDFGFAKYCPEKTYTFVGTPNYVAPELITNGGHNRSVDFWALGVTVYEMITGENPFFFEDMDQASLFHTICQEEYFPLPKDTNDQLVDFIEKLLNKDPAQRLGMLAGGVNDIVLHQWFEGVDLSQVQAKLFPAPWKPTQLTEDAFETMPSCDSHVSSSPNESMGARSTQPSSASVGSLGDSKIANDEERTTEHDSKSKIKKEKKSKKIKKTKLNANHLSINNISYPDLKIFEDFQYSIPEWRVPDEKDPATGRSEKEKKRSELRRSLLKSSFDSFGINEDNI